MAEHEHRRTMWVLVLWDAENIKLPANTSPRAMPRLLANLTCNLLTHVRAALKPTHPAVKEADLRLGSIKYYFQLPSTGTPPSDQRALLQLLRAGIELVLVPNPHSKPERVDFEVVSALDRIKQQMHPEECIVVIVSGDADFLPTAASLEHSGFPVVVVHSSATAHLFQHVQIASLNFTDLLKKPRAPELPFPVSADVDTNAMSSVVLRALEGTPVSPDVTRWLQSKLRELAYRGGPPTVDVRAALQLAAMRSDIRRCQTLVVESLLVVAGSPPTEGPARSTDWADLSLAGTPHVVAVVTRSLRSHARAASHSTTTDHDATTAAAEAWAASLLALFYDPRVAAPALQEAVAAAAARACRGYAEGGDDGAAEAAAVGAFLRFILHPHRRRTALGAVGDAEAPAASLAAWVVEGWERGEELAREHKQGQAPEAAEPASSPPRPRADSTDSSSARRVLLPSPSHRAALAMCSALARREEAHAPRLARLLGVYRDFVSRTHTRGRAPFPRTLPQLRVASVMVALWSATTVSQLRSHVASLFGQDAASMGAVRRQVAALVQDRILRQQDAPSLTAVDDDEEEEEAPAPKAREGRNRGGRRRSKGKASKGGAATARGDDLPDARAAAQMAQEAAPTPRKAGDGEEMFAAAARFALDSSPSTSSSAATSPSPSRPTSPQAQTSPPPAEDAAPEEEEEEEEEEAALPAPDQAVVAVASHEFVRYLQQVREQVALALCETGDALVSLPTFVASLEQGLGAPLDASRCGAPEAATLLRAMPDVVQVVEDARAGEATPPLCVRQPRAVQRIGEQLLTLLREQAPDTECALPKRALISLYLQRFHRRLLLQSSAHFAAVVRQQLRGRAEIIRVLMQKAGGEVDTGAAPQPSRGARTGSVQAQSLVSSATVTMCVRLVEKQEVGRGEAQRGSEGEAGGGVGRKLSRGDEEAAAEGAAVRPVTPPPPLAPAMQGQPWAGWAGPGPSGAPVGPGPPPVSAAPAYGAPMQPAPQAYWPYGPTAPPMYAPPGRQPAAGPGRGQPVMNYTVWPPGPYYAPQPNLLPPSQPVSAPFTSPSSGPSTPSPSGAAPPDFSLE